MNQPNRSMYAPVAIKRTATYFWNLACSIFLMILFDKKVPPIMAKPMAWSETSLVAAPPMRRVRIDANRQISFYVSSIRKSMILMCRIPFLERSMRSSDMIHLG